MRENAIRRIWREGRTVVNGWLATPCAAAAEGMAHQGWDSITLDLQHGLIDYPSAVHQLRAISTTQTVPLARVPWNEPGIIMKLLDAGAYGIICPMIDDDEQARAFVGACRYAPSGYRSVGPLRATLYGGADYSRHANETVLAIAMIETRRAVTNLDAILETPGLDGIYVGPSDLSVSMGHAAGFDPDSPDVLTAIAAIAEAADRHAVPAGIHVGSVAYGLRMMELGYRFITILSEYRLMTWAAGNAVAAIRNGQPDPSAP
ncbi:MAG: aldolase/citrate lyase family protein [bacterium]|nr:aldolase/citrate lyase family protein [bacterium]